MNKKESEGKEQTFNNIVGNIVIYCLIFAVALGFNDVAVTLFNKLPIGQSIVGKCIYLLILFCIIIVIAYFGNVSIDLL